VLERVFGALPGEVERHISQPFETSDLMSIPAGIAACDALFGMRYHACLLALRLGVPTVGIAYDPKVSALFDQAGIPELALEMGAPEDLVLRTLRGVLEDRAVWHDRVGPTVARLEADASKGFAALRSGLDQASTVTTPLIANASLSPSREKEALAQKLSQAKYQLISLSQDDSDAMDQTSAVQKDHIPSHIKTSELLKELKELRASYDQIIYSKSWFVTKPLRWSVRKASAGWRVLRRRLPNLSLPRRASTAMPLDGASAQGKGARLSPNTRELPARLSELRIGVIMDTFTHSCFSEECELISFRPDNWEEVLTHNPPDFLFVESAWHGNDGSWQYRVAEYPAPPGRELPALVAWCKRYGIPTVFWNKEDPPHFDEFLSAAKLFDVVFTSDANCIRKYKKYCGHDRVYPLAFAAQPKIHNPVVTQPRNNKLCFAGSYYADRFDARKKGMETLLKSALKFEFDIFDRMYGAVGPGTEAYRFPQAYMPHIVGRLPYDEMIDAYKRYRVFLNVNSVTDSPTMFSRRVFEILACGTPVVSTDSVGIRRFFPDIVPLVSKPNQATDAFHDLLSDDYQWRRLSALGVRTVMSYHTYQHRLRTICERLGFQMETDAAVQVTVVVFPGLDALKTARQIMAQRISPTNILIRRSNHADELMSALWAEGFHCPVEINEDPRSCVDQTETAVVVFVDGHCSYGPGYIKDALLALSFSGVSATGMSEYFCLSAGEVEMRSDFGPSGLLCGRVHRGTLVCRATQSTAVMFDNLADKDEVLLGNPCYARAPFEFLAGAVLQQEDAAWQRIVLPEISDVQDC
ncbi:MAG: glycosyltransferase, partial [Thiohalocapsa sp.]